MKNKIILITAGPTREYLDPVRYISNGSSGKMGYSVAEEAKKRGAKVILVSGPVNIEPPKGVKFIKVISARDMLAAAKKYFSASDIFIAAAAVSDYRPGKSYEKKIKKTGKAVKLKLVPNPDILLTLSKSPGRRAARPPILAGFALETDNLIKNAREKLKRKNLDMIVANGPETIDSGISTGALITAGGIKRFRHISKQQLARMMLDAIQSLR